MTGGDPQKITQSSSVSLRPETSGATPFRNGRVCRISNSIPCVLISCLMGSDDNPKTLDSMSHLTCIIVVPISTVVMKIRGDANHHEPTTLQETYELPTEALWKQLVNSDRLPGSCTASLRQQRVLILPEWTRCRCHLCRRIRALFGDN